MSELRKLSRSAFPEAWEHRTRLRKLRRLSKAALRAKGRGDLAECGRLEQLLRRFFPSVFSDSSLAPVQTEGAEIVQKGSE